MNIEAETTIRFDEATKEAEIWSASSLFQRKMERLDIVPTKITTRLNGQKNCWYRVPKKWVKIRKPPVLTEKQRLASIERGKALAARQKEKAAESVEA